MDDVLASRFGKTRARRQFWNQNMGRTQRDHAWCCPRVMRWSGQVTQGRLRMLQEPRTEDKSRVTLTELVGFTGNTTRISGQIGLLGTMGVTETDTWVDGWIRLLGIAWLTRATTRVGGLTGLLRTTGVTEMVARVNRLIRLLGSVLVTETETQSQDILAGFMENLANTESRVTENLATTGSQVTENSANMES
jgi:hypothetical protein